MLVICVLGLLIMLDIFLILVCHYWVLVDFIVALVVEGRIRVVLEDARVVVGILVLWEKATSSHVICAVPVEVWVILFPQALHQLSENAHRFLTNSVDPGMKGGLVLIISNNKATYYMEA